MSSEESNVFVFTRYDSMGGVLVVETGLLSFLAILMVFLRIALSVIRYKRHAHPNSTWLLIQVPMDLYMLSLFIADLILGIGMVMNIYWLHSGEMVTGKFCTTQAVVVQLSTIIVPLSNLAITLYTFVAVMWRKGLRSIFAAKLVITSIWLYSAIMLSIAFGIRWKPSQVEEIVLPFRCWTAQAPHSLRIYGIIIWFWATLGFSVLLYAPLYLCSRGILAVSKEAWWKMSIVWPRLPLDEERIRSLNLLLYPLGSIVLCLPLIVVGSVNPQGPIATISSMAIYALCGLYDVAVFLYTRSGLLVVKEIRSQDENLGRLPQPLPGTGGWNLSTTVRLEQEK